MVVEKAILATGKWINGKWVKEATQILKESAPRSKALVNFTTKPTTTLESGKVYTKMKLDHSPAIDSFTSKFTIPTTMVEPANVETFLAGLRASKFSKPPGIPTDIPVLIDFSTATKRAITGGCIVPVCDKNGKLLREYVSASNGKDLSMVKLYDVATGKPRIIINYNTAYGKTRTAYIKELDPSTGAEIKRAMYWDNTPNLKGVRSIDEMGQEVTVKYKENGIDIDYVTHGGKSIYNS